MPLNYKLRNYKKRINYLFLLRFSSKYFIFDNDVVNKLLLTYILWENVGFIE